MSVKPDREAEAEYVIYVTEFGEHVSLSLSLSLSLALLLLFYFLALFLTGNITSARRAAWSARVN